MAAATGDIHLHHPPHVPKKRTMVKDRVGCPRTSTYDLPDGGFVYGKPRNDDPENAGEIISNWVVGSPSQMTKSKYMTVYQNILAIKNGHITAKSMREFGKDHPTIHLKEALTEGTSRNTANHEGPFGRVTAQMDVTMQELIQANFTTYVGDDNDYPDVSAIEDRAVFPRPRATRASLLQRELRERAMQEVGFQSILYFSFKSNHCFCCITGRTISFYHEKIPKYHSNIQHSTNKPIQNIAIDFQQSNEIANEISCEVSIESKWWVLIILFFREDRRQCAQQPAYSPILFQSCSIFFFFFLLMRMC